MKPYKYVLAAISFLLSFHEELIKSIYIYIYIYICLYTCIHTKRYIKIFHSGFVGNWFDPWVEKTPWRREWLPTPVFRPGGFHRQRSPRGHSQTRLSDFHFHFQKLETNVNHKVFIKAIKVAQIVKNLSAKQNSLVQSLGREDPLQKEMATRSCALACEIWLLWGVWRATVHETTKSQTWLSN